VALHEDAVVFGLTGAFGSGCTTLAHALQTELDFRSVKVSDLIKQEHQRRLEEAAVTDAPEGELPLLNPPRGTLQDVGDDLRREHGAHYWMQLILDDIERSGTEVRRLVIDGIRNPGEAAWLRSKIKRFFLIAVDTHPDARWKRLEDNEYWRTRPRAEYDAQSARDMEAPQDWGQRVQQCVDLADYMIVNDVDRERPAAATYLLSRAQDLLGLCQEPTRRPSEAELFMHLAYSSASGSACLKRNVGAVVVRPGQEKEVGSEPVHQAASVLSVGFNENPSWMQPCYHEYGACYRDLWRQKEWESKGYKWCPKCGVSLEDVEWPYECPNPACGAGSLLEWVFPERAMTKCTAIHAEVRAIRSCPPDKIAGSHLYVTTFPCFLCSEEILESEIERVVYFEPYPDAGAEALLKGHGVDVRRFEGVKSLAFLKFFDSWRPVMEKKLALSGRTST